MILMLGSPKNARLKDEDDNEQREADYLGYLTNRGPVMDGGTPSALATSSFLACRSDIRNVGDRSVFDLQTESRMSWNVDWGFQV